MGSTMRPNTALSSALPATAPAARLKHLPAPTVTELLRRWYDTGDADAFQELTLRHAGPAFARLLTRYHPADAADALQDAFVALMTCEPGAARDGVYRAGERNDLCGWLVVTAGRRAIDGHRKTRRLTPESELGVDNGPLDARPAKSAVPPAELLALKECLGKLPAHLRAAVVLHFVESWTRDELAELYDITPNGVKKRINNALAALARCFGLTTDRG